MFANALPSLSICIIALALIKRDAIVLFFGLVLSVISWTVVGLILYYGVRFFKMILNFGS
jgi:hypothetical protein